MRIITRHNGILFSAPSVSALFTVLRKYLLAAGMHTAFFALCAATQMLVEY